MPRKIAVCLALITPGLLLLTSAGFPHLDPALADPVLHFYLVSFIAFAALVVSVFVALSVGQTALPRHLLLALAFVWMAAVFFIHGVTTQGVLIYHFHPAIVWSAWLTLFGGGALFLLAAYSPQVPSPRQRRIVAVGVTLAIGIYTAVVIFVPDGLGRLLMHPQVDVLSKIVFGLTVALWSVGGVRHYLNYRQTNNFLDGLMAFEAGWYATGTVSMFYFPLFHFSWWMYHLLLLLGFLLAIYALWRAYEQVRSFRLTRYYTAAGIVVTAGLALLSAQAYSHFVFQGLLEQLKAHSGAVAGNLALEWAVEVAPGVQTADDLRRLGQRGEAGDRLARKMAGAPLVGAATILDADGSVVASTDPEEISLGEAGAGGPSNFGDFHAALKGETRFRLYAPGELPETYAPTVDVYALEIFVPVRPSGDLASSPIGVLVTVHEAPELGSEVIDSRRSGFALAGSSLGGLFLMLFGIVRRADRLITTRTQELAAANDRLQELDRLKSKFVSDVSHELRTPVTSVTMYLHLLENGKPEKREHYLQVLKDQTARLASMVESILNLSRLELGKARNAFRSVDLNAVVEQTVTAHRPRAEATGLALTYSPDQALTPIRAECNQLSQVVSNLVVNALNYTASGEVHVSTCLSPERTHALLQVEDTGIGIEPDDLPHLFERFYRGHQAAQSDIPGSGLGLAIVKEIVDLHGGRIQVDSRPGAGSTFRVWLPLDGVRPLREPA